MRPAGVPDSQQDRRPQALVDRLIDALVLHGSPGIIAAGLRSHLDAGADHVAIQVLTGNSIDPIPACQQLARALL